MSRIRALLLLGLLLVSAGSFAQVESVLRDAGPIPLRLAGSEDPEESRVYIVQLRAPSAAEEYARTARSAPAAAGKPRARIDSSSAAVKQYALGLVETQQRVLARLGPDTQPIYSYQYGLNGFAARMTAAQAQKLENLPEVLNVWEDEIRPLATRYSPTFLRLFDADEGLRSAAELDGDGIVIGFIDSGVAPEHPALKDTREADRPSPGRSSWPKNVMVG